MSGRLNLITPVTPRKGPTLRRGWFVRALPAGLVLGALPWVNAAPRSSDAAAEGFRPSAYVLRDGAVMAFIHRPAAAERATLVLIPETHGDRSQFLGAVVEALPPAMGIVIVESRGQGSSWPPPAAGKSSIEEYASDVLEIVTHLELRSWFVGGHSLGGMQALEIAGRKPAGLRGVISLEGWTHHEVQAAAFGGLPPRTESQREADRAYRDARYARLRWTPEEYARLVSIWRQWTKGDRLLQDLRYPLLSVWGDRGMNPRPSRETLRLPDAANCELVWIEGADHYVTRMPHAAATGAAIARFIARVEKARTSFQAP